MIKRLGVVVLIGALGLMGCSGGNSPTAPSNTSNISGNWIGTGESTVLSNGSFSARAAFAQTGSSVSGTWSTISGRNGPNSGSLSGTFTNGAISLILVPSDPRTCGFTVTTTLSGTIGRRMDGRYATRNCTVADGGSIYLLKE